MSLTKVALDAVFNVSGDVSDDHIFLVQSCIRTKTVKYWTLAMYQLSLGVYENFTRKVLSRDDEKRTETG